MGGAKVEQDGVKAILLNHRQRVLRVACHIAVTPEPCQKDIDDIPDGGFIFDDQNLSTTSNRGHGNRSRYNGLSGVF